MLAIGFLGLWATAALPEKNEKEMMKLYKRTANCIVLNRTVKLVFI